MSALTLYQLITNNFSASETAEWVALFFKRREPEDSVARKPASSEQEDTVQMIRCPLCKWSPDKFSLWTCWDIGYPEFYFNGCGTEWNTFDTRGVCPTCSHQWEWTSCLSCWGWSKHEDWYESGGPR